MPGIVDSAQPKFLRSILTKNYNWLEKSLRVGQFVVNDYIIQRLTKFNFQNTENYNKHQRLFKNLEDTMLIPIVIIEGNPYELFYKKQRNKFNLAFSDNAYLHYLKSLIIGTKDYQIKFIPAVNQRMTLDILRNLDIEYSLEQIDYSPQIDAPDGISKKRYTNLITHLSAYYGIPFEQLTTEQIIQGIENIQIPSIGKKSKEHLISYFKV